jgi:cytochrome oxidase Cu insertion factor (SCO1/SenC/PrrC family)
MRSKLVVALALALVVGLLAGTAFAAKLLCITNKNLRGETTVGECLAKGDKFAVVDQYGVPQILSNEDIEVFKALNPGAMNMKAYSTPYYKEAPEIPMIQDRTPG